MPRPLLYLVRLGCASLCLGGIFPCLADEGVFAFVDRQGEVHLSNIPDDNRYQMLDAPSVAANAATNAASPRESSAQRPFGTVVARAAARFGVEPALLHAVISVESGYNPRAVSKRGAAGLMQLMPATAKRYGVVNVFDPAENVRAGAQYLGDLLKLFDNDLKLALAAYNAGEGAVLKYGKSVPPYRETAAYIPKVFDFYEKLRSLM
jgi:soluble lytic murein transglycosylase-like protein